MKTALLFLLFVLPLAASDRFGLTIAQADARWPVHLAQSAQTTINGITLTGRHYVSGGWQFTALFYDGSLEGFDYTKRGEAGAVVAPTEEEIGHILTLFGLYLASEQRFIYRQTPPTANGLESPPSPPTPPRRTTSPSSPSERSNFSSKPPKPLRRKAPQAFNGRSAKNSTASAFRASPA
jgi:hypothetical protein